MPEHNQKIFFRENLKFLRTRKNKSQEALAEALGYTRAKIAALESGHTKSPQPEDYIALSQHFKISIDSLIKINLGKLSELQIRELEAGNDVYMTGSKIRVLAISTDKNNKENSEYVPIKAKAGYQSGYTDPDYIAALPKFNIPILSRNHTYRTFPIEGDSMLPIPSGSLITGKYTDNWKNIKPMTPCVVILNHTADFVFKMVSIQDNNTVLLTSLNKNYTPYSVPSDEVLEIWVFAMLHTSELPQQSTDMDTVKTMFQAILNNLNPKDN